ncbi:MAG: NAD(P)H-hydrate epimerase, partial [Oscillospiraceae bacterium]|nr:NAD(P)H-hydrate epimerase [Oscillospiraceae bacterium]
MTSAQMKQIEENALAYDMTYARMMENAGSAAAAFIRRTFRIDGLNCLIFCGPGNNGGDGFVVARRLFENGANVVIVLVDDAPTTEESMGMFQSAERMEITVFELPQDIPKITTCVQQADIVVDAIYGTGFHGALTGNAKIASEMIADAIAAVISLDIPSGVECDTAKVGENAVQADFTVVFDTLKPVHVILSGLTACGNIELVEIGLPPEAHDGVEGIFRSITTDMVLNCLPVREPHAHKGDYGTLLCICGSMSYRGAAALCALGALRCGVGICRVAAVEPVCAAISASLFEP